MIDFIDSKALVQYSWDFLQSILLQPRSLYEFYVSLGLAYLALVICLSQVHSLGSGSGSFFISIFVAAFCVYALIEVAALMRLFVLPVVPDTTFHSTLVYLSLLVSLVLLVTPFTRTLFRAGYLSSLTAWIIALFIAGLLIHVSHVMIHPKVGDRTPTLQAVTDSVQDLRRQYLK